MIYLASPYTSPSKRVMQERFAITRFYCNLRMKKGDLIFSPIVYGHQFAVEFRHPTDFTYWKGFNDYMLSISKEMHILRLPGWQKSKGVAHEINQAKALNIPITHLRSYG